MLQAVKCQKVKEEQYAMSALWWLNETLQQVIIKMCAKLLPALASSISFIPTAFIGSLIYQACNERLHMTVFISALKEACLVQQHSGLQLLQLTYVRSHKQKSKSMLLAHLGRTFWAPYLDSKVFSYVQLTFLGLLSFKLVVHVMVEKRGNIVC